MSGDVFFLFARDHSILGSFADISEAREALHENMAAQYVARADGIVMAYMSREGQTWRPIAKVPPEARPALTAAASAQ
jgi:hypothetical protein